MGEPNVHRSCTPWGGGPNPGGAKSQLRILSPHLINKEGPYHASVVLGNFRQISGRDEMITKGKHTCVQLVML